ncbi:hypothetical protein BJX63DRAFT_381919, partial [Aspergillus granulosus]
MSHSGASTLINPFNLLLASPISSLATFHPSLWTRRENSGAQISLPSRQWPSALDDAFLELPESCTEANLTPHLSSKS